MKIWKRDLGVMLWGAILLAATMAGPAAAGGPEGLAGDGVPVIVSTATGAGARPLAAVTVTESSVQCSYGPVVMGTDGTVGYILPVLGPAVLRAAAEPLTTVVWKVVKVDEAAARPDPALANAFAVCTKAQ